MPFLVLGEALVDLICEQPAEGPACAAEAIVAEGAQVVSAIGAGDAFLGTLIAGLQRTGWDPAHPGARDALAAAAEAGARATETWGATA
jgi:sugar/nucleoside kinase (ribokinase family)